MNCKYFLELITFTSHLGSLTTNYMLSQHEIEIKDTFVYFALA